MLVGRMTCGRRLKNNNTLQGSGSTIWGYAKKGVIHA